jgi:hypothetical protein
LRAAGNQAVETLLDGMIGRADDILMETETVGRHANYAPVRVDSLARPGDVVPVALTAREGQTLSARRL